ncbi:hypothetical protein [Pantoea agglomerans]|uniref:Uncharacterized protein n=1 Tax=Enterobacter agglomerans TaxID=549 RepID=A0ACC5PVL5_ENTAG|nr:hypothetical protein [Pantoea agglomerans]MBD8129138.1 hypothetical protein [Pantoea agglomerans]MBD8234816.1 hypothetical protein [Pantoea agglomerans]MBD8245229.1 hypothetical protein [Pantoea agglomerans]WVL83679.1 hypothetical protein IFU02_003905 [Pantoea agglomerans]
MFSKSDLEKMDDEQLNLYMDWLLESISRCEAEADSHTPEIVNQDFHRLKERMMRQDLKRHSQELRRVLDEKKSRLYWWCH